jgi:D-cysteine desulfhydrase family pyridoxal phosphate-dependent enzyme
MNAQLATSLQNLKTRLNTFPRIPLCNLPTPLEKLANLSRKLNLNLYIKRDDETGLAMGGNKARKLEFIMADALAQGADSIVTWASVQSNWCRQLAAAARVVGIEPFLILFKRPGLPSEQTGNLLLDDILGADITVVQLEEGSSIMNLHQVQPFVDSVIERARKAGRKPYLAPIGGSLLEGSMNRPWGAIGYVNAMLELTEQAEAQEMAIDHLVFATSSGSTHAGLLAGVGLLASRINLVAISMSEKKCEIAEVVKEIANQVLLEFAATDLPREIPEVSVFDDYVGKGYGVLNSEITRAIRMVAENEGILLDPVYTGKAMAGLLDLCETSYFEPKANVVFLHTGGTPALFSYGDAILEDRQIDSRV